MMCYFMHGVVGCVRAKRTIQEQVGHPMRGPFWVLSESGVGLVASGG